MPLMKTTVIAVSIEAGFDTVVADLSNPLTHPEWGTEFFDGPLAQGADGDYEGSSKFMGGAIRYKVDAVPERGIFDLYIAPRGAPFGPPLPMRVTPNAKGVDVLWVLHLLPGMTDDVFEAGAASLRREADWLKRRFES